jgi:hypothetical protein
MTIPRHCSTSELAALLGITAQGVNKLTESRVLRRVGRGKYDLAESIQAHSKHRETLAAKRVGGGAFNEAKTRKMQADAARAEDDLQKSRGALIPIEDMKKALDLMAHMAKTLFLASPSRMAPKLARASTPAECQELLLRENRTILQRIGDSSFKQIRTPRGTYNVKIKYPTEEAADREANPRYRREDHDDEASLVARRQGRDGGKRGADRAPGADGT